MTKQEFLKRCEVFYDNSKDLEKVLELLFLSVDFTIRTHGKQEQIAHQTMQKIDLLSKGRVLASFSELLQALKFAERLNLNCQKCAEKEKTPYVCDCEENIF